MSISVSEINQKSMSYLTPLLETLGFKKYKNKQFLRIENDIVFFVQIFPSKKDFYIWYSAYPLFQNDLWFGAGILADRIPSEEKKLQINNEDELFQVIKKLESMLPGMNSFFKKHSTNQSIIDAIPDNSKIYPLMIKGFCLASLGLYSQAKPLLEIAINSGLQGDDIDGAKTLVNSFPDKAIEVLNNNKTSNIKKLKLTGYINND